MVFIHGGGFYGGSANAYGPEFLVNNDVILVSGKKILIFSLFLIGTHLIPIQVTLNYRLGAFGFLSLGTAEYSGNMGLKDQLSAIRWVNENIEQFGGDKSAITLFGESAGAASTHYHVISPVSRGLFQRAIVQSASTLSRWSYSDQKNHLERLKQIGK